MNLNPAHDPHLKIAVYLFAVVGLLSASTATAATVAVVGVPHLASLDPAPTLAQRQAVVNLLASFEPTIVCIEAMPGERIEQFLEKPDQHGKLLRHFGLTAVMIGPEQQVRLGLSRQDARAAASELERQGSSLDTDQRLRLIGLQLAAFEPWSALLNWTYLDESGQAMAASVLGDSAVERLQQLAKSSNEVVTLAIPLARRTGLRRVCAVDSFVDEATVQTLAGELMPIIRDAGVQAGIKAFEKEQSANWSPEGDGGLVQLLAWMNSDQWAQRDRTTQWDIFDSGIHDAASSRLMLWHARNSEIITWLFRAIAEVDGERPILIIGGAHRPFIEQALEAHRWVDVVPASLLIEP